MEQHRVCPQLFVTQIGFSSQQDELQSKQDLPICQSESLSAFSINTQMQNDTKTPKKIIISV